MYLKWNQTPKLSVKTNRKDLIDQALQEVADAIGVPLIREYMPLGHDYEVKLRVEQIPAPHGFVIKIHDDYLSWKVEIDFDTFSGPLLSTMQARYPERMEGLSAYLDLAKAKNNTFSLQVNGQEGFPTEGSDWHYLNFKLSKSYFSIDNEFESLSSVLLDFMCVVLYLIVEATEWKEDGYEGEEEGALISVLSNKFERSRYNRALCLKYYGFKCRGCGDLLQEKYPIGVNVIHVHHIVPLSKMGGSYKLDPIKDLIPLCPNCHNVVHAKTPPITIEELKNVTGYSD